MVAAVVYDLDASPFTQGQNGNRWLRRFRIDGLDSGPDIPTLINECLVALPNVGTAAPAPIVNMFLRENTIERISLIAQSNPARWEAEGFTTYTTPNPVVGGTIGLPDDDGPGVTLSSVANIEEIETDRDRAGAQITTTFDNVTMAHQARTFRGGLTLTFTRLESSSPRDRQNTHQGTLNSSVWNGYSAESVLCQSIDSDTDDFGTSYTVTYTFIVRSSWKFRAVHEDPFFPGHPLPGATGAAVAEVDLIPTSNFALLNITLP